MSASGNNTFTGTTTILGINNLCVEVSFVDVVNVTSVTLTDNQYGAMQTSYTYRLSYSMNVEDSGATVLALIFNQDTASNYRGQGQAYYGGSYYPAGIGSNALYAAPIVHFNGNSFGIGTAISGVADLSAVYGKVNRRFSRISASFYETNNSISALYTNSFTYLGASDVSTLSIVASTAWVEYATTRDKHFSGHFELWRCGYKMGP